MTNNKLPIGSIGWLDLTVPDAAQVREFYTAVTGWTHEEVSMGDYADFNMIPPGAEGPVAGICHARGTNADLPSQWIIYIIVEDLEAGLQACTKLGGTVLAGPKSVGSGGRYAIVRDPAGAVAGLYQE